MWITEKTPAKIKIVTAFASIEPDDVTAERIECDVWCYECPVNRPPPGDEAYAAFACGDILIKGHHWQGYQLDKNKKLLVECNHPGWARDENEQRALGQRQGNAL